jgi:hypothetical protein
MLFTLLPVPVLTYLTSTVKANTHYYCLGRNGVKALPVCTSWHEQQIQPPKSPPGAVQEIAIYTGMAVCLSDMYVLYHTLVKKPDTHACSQPPDTTLPMPLQPCHPVPGHLGAMAHRDPWASHLSFYTKQPPDLIKTSQDLLQSIQPGSRSVNTRNTNLRIGVRVRNVSILTS